MIPITTPLGDFRVWTKRVYHHCANGSHFSFVDDQESYFAGLTQFLTALSS